MKVEIPNESTVKEWVRKAVHKELANIEKRVREMLAEVQNTVNQAGAPASDDLNILELANLSTRTFNALTCANIETVGQLCAKTEDQLCRLRNFGKFSLMEVKRELQYRGRELGDRPTQSPAEPRPSTEQPRQSSQ